jgi:hypothetical protein
MRMMMSEEDDDEATLPDPHPPGQRLMDETGRLRTERDLLLSTGNYSHNDPIIQTLTRLILERESAGAAAGGPVGGGGSESQASTITFDAAQSQQEKQKEQQQKQQQPQPQQA